MKHLGDITKISGYEAPVVDCVIGGSPCQDLSVAGKRAGLAGERSGLYMEQIRIIKEMRRADELRGRTDLDIRPRYMVWENVPGAFSSNGGKDFAAVIEEAIRVAEPQAPDVRVPEKGWPTSGCFWDELGRWSVAWRVLDAQFWGTSDKPLPQRRRRIALVADFGGLSAPEILFVRKSVSGDLEPGEPKGKAVAGTSGECAGGTDQKGECVAFHLLQDPIASKNCTPCMGAGSSDHGQASIGVVFSAGFKGGQGAKASGIGFEEGIAPTLAAAPSGSNQVPNVVKAVVDVPVFALDQQAGKGGANYAVDVMPTICSDSHGTPHAVVQPVVDSCILDDQGGSQISIRSDGKCPTLRAETHGNLPCVMDVLPFDTTQITSPKNYSNPKWGDPSHPLAAGAHPAAVAIKTYQKVTGPLMANSHPGSYTGQDAFNDMLVASEEKVIVFDKEVYNSGKNCVGGHYISDGGQASTLRTQKPPGVCTRNIVRRLTPLEYERLQGYPDGWTDIGEWVDSKGKKHKEADSPRYKALGNSIAIPPWKWVLKRLCACYERDATMASLFDGIGGFPYIWEQLNGKGSCLWASEIEEFPMAVTKLRFGGSEL